MQKRKETSQALNIATFAESIFKEDQMKQDTVKSTLDEHTSARTIVTNIGGETSSTPVGQD